MLILAVGAAFEPATGAAFRYRSRETRSPTHVRIVATLGLLCALVAGCSPGVRWRGLTYGPVQADAQRDGKLTFVYLRNWMMPACTRFEENVLKAPEVLHALDDMYCVVLDFYQDRPLADKWGVATPPAIVILDLERRVLARASGDVTAAELLGAIATAKDRFSVRAPPVPTE